jgi:squalene-hopene/tetraprenyl-beta-curcumene cyclase
MRKLHRIVTTSLVMLETALFAADRDQAPHWQYRHGEIEISLPTAREPLRAGVSVELAERYLRDGAVAWRGSKGCIACHTTGLYQTIRPALTPQLGAPLESMRAFFLDELAAFQLTERKDLQRSTKPAQVIYLAAGLAEWDAHVRGSLSPETRAALELMFSLQLESGTWGSLDCWPPYESDAFHLATVAAQAAGTAPGWLAGLENPQLRSAVARLRGHLTSAPPPHDYARVLLLWAEARMPGLVTAEAKARLVALVRKRQQADGGWSLRAFAQPEEWGRGNRAKKLRAEPEFDRPLSDGHMTGLAIIVLRESGVPADDPALRRGVAWLKSNQRESGRWWTRSLNTDKYHYITYSGTAFPLLALGLCGELEGAE